MTIIWQVALILLLILLNGFFVASEFALVAVRKTRIVELARKGDFAAKLIQKALSQLDLFISATQLGVTIASLGLGWVGEPMFADILKPIFASWPKELMLISAHSLAIACAFILITFFHIVLGELVPKTFALQKAEVLASFIIIPLYIFSYVFRPFIWIVKSVSNLLLKGIGLYSTSSAYESVHSEEEVKMILAQSASTGAIPQKEAEMVNNVFRLSEIPVKHIMVPRTEIVAFALTTKLKDVVSQIEKSIHSRYPIYEQSIDTITGFIHIKDIYKAALKINGEKKLHEMNFIREIIHVPETKKADRVLLDMRKKRIHIAVVNDEFGGTAGMVTLEDLLESLVGEIQDEFEEPAIDMQRQTDGSYLVDGLTPIEKIQTKFNIPLRGQGFTTIGGLVFGLLGREPHKDDKIQIGTIVVSIEEMQKKRIRTLRIKKEKAIREKSSR